MPRPKQQKLNVLVLHTTEGGGWPGFGGGRKAPNLTLNCTSGRPQWRQHWPLPCASMALRQPSGSPSTNRMNVCQVELVGTGGWLIGVLSKGLTNRYLAMESAGLKARSEKSL